MELIAFDAINSIVWLVFSGRVAKTSKGLCLKEKKREVCTLP
jgi:hypothetical protein